MEAPQKKTLKAICLELRHLLEGWYDAQGKWHPGDLEQRLAAIGVRRGREPLPVADLTHLTEDDLRARQVVDAYLQLRQEAGITLTAAVAEFVRETAYTWANRLLALRCMESRELIDEVILQKEVYGGRSLEHHRLAQRQPELCTGEDDGLFAVLHDVFTAQAQHLPLLFDPQAPGVALKPSPSALKRSLAMLSGTEAAKGQEPATSDLFKAPDVLGWAYQYWNNEEKDRIFEKVRTQKGAKIEGPDLIPVTQLYTEPYMVKFLVQNSLGALWLGMHPQSRLPEQWDYFVRDANRAPVKKRSAQEITFLDPACGSGHFLLEAFDLFYEMYREEGELTDLAEICQSVLENNLFGIDIDERAVQIAAAALWMKAAEKAFDFRGTPTNLVATNIRLPKGKDHLHAFLKKHPEDEPLRPALEAVFRALEHADEIGSLLQIEEPVDQVLRRLKEAQNGKRASGFQRHLYQPTPVQSELPLGVESYEEWKKKTLAALKKHFEAEAVSADLAQSFFSRSAGKGLAFFDLLCRRYDVISANPPYIAASRLSIQLKNNLAEIFEDKLPDIYAGFIYLFNNLLIENGYLAYLTLHGWMFLSTFRKVREDFLKIMSINSLVHLGTGTMKELSNPNAQGFCLFIAQKIATDLIGLYIDSTRLSEKDYSILSAIETKERTYEIMKSAFIAIEGSPLAYWIPKKVLEAIHLCYPLSKVTDVRQGFITGDNNRFLRFFWESAIGRWILYSKGGKYLRFGGNEQYVLDWGHEGIRLKNFLLPSGRPKSRIQNSEFLGREGITWTALTTYAFSARLMRSGGGFDATGPALFPHIREEIPLWISFCNSRWTSFALRALNPTITFREGYVAKVPVPILKNRQQLTTSGQFCMNVRLSKCSLDIGEYLFNLNNFIKDDSGLRANSIAIYELEMLLDALISTGLKIIDDEVFESLEVMNSEHLLSAIFEGSGGMPTHYMPAIQGYDSIPVFADGLEVPPIIQLVKIDVTHLNSDELSSVKNRLRSLYEKGPRARAEIEDTQTDEHEEESEEAENILTLRASTPTETFLEELSVSLGHHPISVYWLLKEGIEQDGWRCLPEERRTTADRFTVMTLRFLGHRWPREVEAGDPEPDCVDPEGFLPLTPGVGKATLLERLRDRIAAEFQSGQVAAIEREFAEIMGRPLDQWLTLEFFKHHTRQFKKRPIAWQVQSGKFSARQQPAFACFLYYHKVEADTLPKLRTHYVGPLRQRYETEQRGIEAISMEARSDRQERRRVALDGFIQELKGFDAILEQVATQGFGPPRVRPQLRQAAIDDAMLCLKSAWLRRLGQVIEAGPLPAWLKLAAETGLNCPMEEWIADAFAHLNYHCSALGPKAPAEKDLAPDPDASFFAGQIALEAEKMLEGALHLACQEWWQKLDQALLAPIRKEISQAREEIKRLDQEIASYESRPHHDILKLKRTKEDLKSKIKARQHELNELTGRADSVRMAIESWTCPEAETWEPWLAEQPMYDAISSLDGKKPPPETVADFIRQEGAYAPDINDGVRVNIAPLQKAGLLAAEVLAAKDVDKAIADRIEWRADERRWVREGKLPQPGWWPTTGE